MNRGHHTEGKWLCVFIISTGLPGNNFKLIISPPKLKENMKLKTISNLNFIRYYFLIKANVVQKLFPQLSHLCHGVTKYLYLIALIWAKLATLLHQD